MYYGLSLLVAGLLLRLWLAFDKSQRTLSPNERQYASFSAYRNNLLLRAVAKLLGLLSVLSGLLLMGLSLVRRLI